MTIIVVEAADKRCPKCGLRIEDIKHTQAACLQTQIDQLKAAITGDGK